MLKTAIFFVSCTNLTGIRIWNFWMQTV